MRYSCGETWEATQARLGQWHRKFALFPRTVGSENGRHVCVWLEYYERKGKYYGDWECSWWSWEYREIV
jgi:hypothetical protein